MFISSTVRVRTTMSASTAPASPRTARPLRASAVCACARSSSRMAPRGVQAEHRHIGRLVVVQVLAGGLAQRCAIPGSRRGCRRPPGRPGRSPRRSRTAPRQRASVGAAAGGAHQHAGLQQRAGLAPVHVAQRAARPAAGRCWPGRWPGRRPCRHGRPSAPAARTAVPAAPASTPCRPGVSTSKASACIASPASIACASPNCTCTVGLPRRSTSLSMHGMSSCTSE